MTIIQFLMLDWGRPKPITFPLVSDELHEAEDNV